MKEAQAMIRIVFPSERLAAILLNALKPETETSLTRRSKVEVKLEGKNLIFFFKARDTTALRASINSHMRWVMVIEDVLSRVSLSDKVAFGDGIVD